MWLTRLVALACVLSLSGYLGGYYFLFEQIDSFRAQYFVVAGVGVLLALGCRQWWVGVVLVVVCLLHGSELARFYLPSQTSQEPPALRLMSVNLLASNRDSTRLLDEIARVNPDIIVFQEYTPRWRQALAAALSAYPHRVEEVINSPFGIAAYSRLPYTQQSISYFSQNQSPAIDIRVMVEDQPVRVLGIHPVPPVSAATYQMRNRYFDDIITQALASADPLVVMGDFNATPWSFHFKNLLDGASLKSTRDGSGFYPTWPGGFWPLWTPIDHIVHNNKLQLVRFDTGKRFGSDHTPVLADLVLSHTED